MNGRVVIALLVLAVLAWTQGLVPITHVPGFPDRDFDRDGLSNERERALGTNAFKADSDGDGLDDWYELSALETDPTTADTDDDEFSDSVELVGGPPIAGADPLQRDVFVEIDYVTGKRPSRETLDRVAAVFEAAPVRNPDGSTGIDVHFVIDDEIGSPTATTPKELSRIRKAHFDNSSVGYHYAVFVGQAGGENRTRTGFQSSGPGYRQMAIEYQGGDFAGTFVHELGHSLGIDADDYAGVDSYAVSAATYPSVMNYNYPDSPIRLTHDGPFDDWEHINDSQINPRPREIRRRLTRARAEDDGSVLED
ncbi:hypothetical protein ACFR9U_03025 [Halorientalis brevis]|uniref:Uncharacterized protein n=1 Tax=Halorientalis brevis TaxID=1126241 RepID=A0ABD6C6K8_9EURY|nr:hypothetical protein [Halorientalis brevis]